MDDWNCWNFEAQHILVGTRPSSKLPEFRRMTTKWISRMRTALKKKKRWLWIKGETIQRMKAPTPLAFSCSSPKCISLSRLLCCLFSPSLSVSISFRNVFTFGDRSVSKFKNQYQTLDSLSCYFSPLFKNFVGCRFRRHTTALRALPDPTPAFLRYPPYATPASSPTHMWMLLAQKIFIFFWVNPKKER